MVFPKDDVMEEHIMNDDAPEKTTRPVPVLSVLFGKSHEELIQVDADAFDAGTVDIRYGFMNGRGDILFYVCDAECAETGWYVLPSMSYEAFRCSYAVQNGLKEFYQGGDQHTLLGASFAHDFPQLMENMVFANLITENDHGSLSGDDSVHDTVSLKSSFQTVTLDMMYEGELRTLEADIVNWCVILVGDAKPYAERDYIEQQIRRRKLER